MQDFVNNILTLKNLNSSQLETNLSFETTTLVEYSSKTIAQAQYEMLIDEPFVHTQEDVLFEVWLARQDMGPLAADERDAIRADYFSKGRACLRASPLTKTHGWGIVFDDQGRAALCARESPEYAANQSDDSLDQLFAMRSRRA